MPINYSINVPSVAAETLDQETVIINFTTGLYYHADGVGAAIWQSLESGESIESIIEHLLAVYSGDSTEIANGVSSFITDLERESLIVPSQEAPSSAYATLPEQATDPVPFSAPVLNIYTDMAELLLLDPVHELEDRSRGGAENCSR